MPRIRTIKPDFWDDPKIGHLSRDARLLFIATWNLADDAGTVRWAPDYLKARVFMYDSDILTEDSVRLMDELTRLNFVTPFEVAGESFASINNFNRHQTITRPSAARFPSPTSENVKLGEPSVSPHRARSEGSVQEREREREGEGRHSPSGSDARTRAPARMREGPDLAPATIATSITAADVVAAWVEATQFNGVSPTARSKGMVAKEAKSLLDSGNDPDRVLKAAFDAGTKGFPNIERELMALSGKAVPRYLSSKPTRDDKVRALRERAEAARAAENG